MSNTTKVFGIPASNTVVSLYIPNTFNVYINGKKTVHTADKVIRQTVIDILGQEFTRLFGGCTIDNIRGNADIVGLWIDQNSGQIVQENVTRIYSYCGSLSVQDCDILKALALDIKRIFNQDSVMLSINNNVWYL